MDAKDRLIAKQAKEIGELRAKVAEFEALLKKNSGTSSKPPSSDIVKLPKPKSKDKDGKEIKRKIGAQPGHKQHLRTPIAPELVDEIVKLELTHCPDCGHTLSLDKIEPKKSQHIELVEKPVTR